MAITVPIADTELSVSTFGKPLVDEVNRLTPIVDANKSDITALKSATAVTGWTNFTLLNNWVQYGGARAPCSYSKVGDVVFVRIAAISGTVSVPICQLPVGFRPMYNLDFIGRDSSAAGAGVFNINNDGNIIYYGASTALNALNVSFRIV